MKLILIFLKKKNKTPQKLIISSPQEFAIAYPRGTPAYVPALGKDGIIQSEPDAKGLVTVIAQSMRVQIPWKDIEPAKNISSNSSRINRKLGTNILAIEDRVVDIRGQRVDEAIRELEIELDQAMINREERIKIIHGHGTEALKKAIRTYLSRSIYVRKWRSGDTQSGGDGVTWVELSDGLS